MIPAVVVGAAAATTVVVLRDDDAPVDVAAPSVSTVPLVGDLSTVRVGDCLRVDREQHAVAAVRCTDTGALQVVLRRDGTTVEDACDGVAHSEALVDERASGVVLCLGSPDATPTGSPSARNT